MSLKGQRPREKTFWQRITSTIEKDTGIKPRQFKAILIVLIVVISSIGTVLGITSVGGVNAQVQPTVGLPFKIMPDTQTVMLYSNQPLLLRWNITMPDTSFYGVLNVTLSSNANISITVWTGRINAANPCRVMMGVCPRPVQEVQIVLVLGTTSCTVIRGVTTFHLPDCYQTDYVVVIPTWVTLNQ